MLQIETKNHLGQVIGSEKIEAWQKRENTLMAIVFGFAAYLPYKSLLGPIVEDAKLIGSSSRSFPANVHESDISKVELWPPQPVENGRPGKPAEPDAKWSFKSFNLVIEAKKIGVGFTQKQLQKYVDIPENSSKPLWVLAVGRGSAATRSLAGINLGKNVSLLYIDWQSIVNVVRKQLSNKKLEAHVERCLEDIKVSLEGRKLKPFDGFYCREGSLKDIGMTVGKAWFPTNLWSVLPRVLHGIKPQFHRWLTRPLWVLNAADTLKFSPIVWFTK